MSYKISVLSRVLTVISVLFLYQERYQIHLKDFENGKSIIDFEKYSRNAQ